MTAVEVYQGGLGESIVVFGNLAGQIAKTEFVPQEFRGRPEAVLACMLFGQECGLGPMASLNLTQNIKGKVGLKPEGMRAVVQAHGHKIWTEEYDDKAVTLCGQRKGEEHVAKVRWTLEDAKRAQLTSNPSWTKYPRAMLMARATSELCRLHFSDCTGGMAYGADELEEIAAPRPAAQHVAAGPSDPGVVHVPAGVDRETGEIVDAEVVEAPAPASRRRKPPTAAAPAPVEEPFPPPADPVELASEDDRDAIATILKRYSGNTPLRDELMKKWSEAGIGSFKAVERFTADDAAKALDLLADFQVEHPTLDAE